MGYNIKAIRDFAKSQMSGKRFRHTEGVVHWAVELATIHQIDAERARVASYLHDVAKEMAFDDAVALLRRHRAMQAVFFKMPRIIHAYSGAYVARDVLKISDTDVLNAIRYHTTGHPAMSALAKLIYVADATEAGRSVPKLRERRRQAKRDLDAATLSITADSIGFLTAKRRLIHSDTIALYNHLLEEEEA